MFEASYDGKNRKILWQEMWRHEFEEAVKHNPIVIVPTGSIEQHGPHSPVDVDISDSFLMGVKVASKIEDFPVIVVPPVWFGYSHYHMGYPGVISLRADTYTSLIIDICRSVNANGFKRILILNGHGGNVALNRIVQADLSEEDIFLVQTNWWDLVLKEMAALSTSDGSDVGHAGEWETSVQLYLRPQLILKERMVADKDTTNPFSDEVKEFMPGDGVFAYGWRDTLHGSGAMGNPLEATPDKGREVVDAVVTKLEKLIREYHGLPLRHYREFGSYTP